MRWPTFLGFSVAGPMLPPCCARTVFGATRRVQIRSLIDLALYAMLGTVIGGRLGQVIFYEPGYYAAHPLEIPALWQGGMSFHGGLIGVLLAIWYFAYRVRISFLTIADLVATMGEPLASQLQPRRSLSGFGDSPAIRQRSVIGFGHARVL